MGRYVGPSCKLCRREGTKLFLKGTRCETAKCVLGKRDHPPGQHKWRRGRTSAYGIQLREKQKLKRAFGIREAQLRMVFRRAARTKANTGITLLALLERRLDNVVCLLGFALSRKQARQMVTHGHFSVNNRCVDIPSYTVVAGDIIRPRTEPVLKLVQENLEITQGRPVPGWLVMQKAPPQGEVSQLPTREDISFAIDENLVVELCSK